MARALTSEMIDERLRQHKLLYGVVPGRTEAAYITVPLTEWNRLQKQAGWPEEKTE
jgi:hypothetical protein